MPHKPEHAQFYRSPEWKATRARILERAGNRCECTGECGDAHNCGAPNGAIIARHLAPPWQYHVHYCSGGCMVLPCDEFEPHGFRVVRVVLTIAHLDHDTGQVPDNRLKALCQRCHLRADRHQHATNSAATRRRKRALTAPELALGDLP